jgi:hypothetical protein
MTTMAPTRPTEPHACRVRLTAGPAAAAEARRRVRAVIGAWHAPVDPDVAVLLTSDLVTNALRHEAVEAVTLAVRGGHDQLRVDVHCTSRCWPVVADTLADTDCGPGLILVAILSDEWGSYHTAEGKAVYFTLAFQPEFADGGGRDPG